MGLLLCIYITHIYFPASGQAVVTGVVPSPPRFLPTFFISHRVQQSHCSLIFHRVLLTHALALSASQFVRKKKPRIYTSMHSAGFELVYQVPGSTVLAHGSPMDHPRIHSAGLRVTHEFAVRWVSHGLWITQGLPTGFECWPMCRPCMGHR